MTLTVLNVLIMNNHVETYSCRILFNCRSGNCQSWPQRLIFSYLWINLGTATWNRPPPYLS